ncbi:site-specific integrase [Actinopolymorpha sp. B17G11]|uniref:site-specific integrase n=1 Tax=Actinopolymorpha sp. B17G11 TaxID=3160861 RepID=UPI0032E51985
MPRRGHGEGTLYWDEGRQRWIVEVTTGYTPRGKRIKVRRHARTKTDARTKLRELRRTVEDGLPIEPQSYTVSDAVEDWLRSGLRGRSDGTIEKNTIWARSHVNPALGGRKLRELSADDVDRWLDEEAAHLSTDSLRQIYSVLKRTVDHAQARDKVKRNVVSLCNIPRGRPGRRSKSLSLDQARAVLDAAEQDDSVVGDYIVVSLTTGARTEEARALAWDLVDLVGTQTAGLEAPPSIAVWRSVRESRDTKTEKSRRTLKAPERAVRALGRQRKRQLLQRARSGTRWQETGLVFTTRDGTQLDARNVRRSFKRIVQRAGLDPEKWTPRELRHSFVSLLSNHAGLSIEEIARLVGHATTSVTQNVYRFELRPMLIEGADAMDRLLAGSDDECPSD